MFVIQLQLSDYRNYRTLDLQPSAGLNVVVGANGQGKSNILEAIYLLATTRSMRAHRDQELVRIDTELARVVARVGREVRQDVAIEIDILANHKVGKVNGVRHTRLVDLLGEFNAVQFTPTDVDLITGGPPLRRGFLNLQIAQTSGSYAYALIYYKRVLEQRNRLLRDAAKAGGMSSSGKQALEVLTEQLIGYGGQIMERRGHFVRSLAIYADRIHRDLVAPDAALHVVYQPGWPGATTSDDPPAEALRKALDVVRTDEMRRGMTLAGPHRDDLQFTVNGMDARIYASRGEQRTVALSMKLAEFLLLQELNGEAPVMLLDDVLSELDDDRALRVIQELGPGQAFITGASLRIFPSDIISHATMFRVRDGALQPSA